MHITRRVTSKKCAMFPSSDVKMQVLLYAVWSLSVEVRRADLRFFVAFLPSSLVPSLAEVFCLLALWATTFPRLFFCILVTYPYENHRMVCVGRDLIDHLVTTPLPWAGTPSTTSGYSKPHPTWPWMLKQGWNLKVVWIL